MFSCNARVSILHLYTCVYVCCIAPTFFPKNKRQVPLPLRLLLDGLVAMLKIAMRARMTRGSKNRAEVINEGRCNGIDWSGRGEERCGRVDEQ